jgi:hypothetical protein
LRNNASTKIMSAGPGRFSLPIIALGPPRSNQAPVASRPAIA